MGEAAEISRVCGKGKVMFWVPVVLGACHFPVFVTLCRKPLQVWWWDRGTSSSSHLSSGRDNGDAPFLIFAKPFSCCFQFFQRILVYFHTWYKFFYFFVKAYKRFICDNSAFLYAFQMGNNFPAFQQCFWSVTINVLENKQDVDRIL